MLREHLIETYLDYLNEYLSVEIWAAANGVTTEQGYAYLKLAREVCTTKHPEA